MPRKKTILTAEEVKAQIAELTKTTKKTTKKTATEKLKKDENSILKKKIADWCDKMYIRNYKINDDLTIDVIGFCNLRGYLNDNLPDYIQFGTIYPHPIYQTTDFDISDCSINTLRGCPHTVYGNFKCCNTKVSSLEYAPKVVKSTFVFYGNTLEVEDFMIEDICKCTFVQTYKNYIWNPKEWGLEKRTAKKEAKSTTKKSIKKSEK